nr:hypothetical protein [Adlercreutzia sp. R21]
MDGSGRDAANGGDAFRVQVFYVLKVYDFAQVKGKSFDVLPKDRFLRLVLLALLEGGMAHFLNGRA